MKVLKVPTGSSPVYPRSSRLPQNAVGSRVATPKEAQAKSTTEKAKLAPVSEANWGRYVKDLEELWKKGTDPRWEDWKGGIEQTLAWEKSRNSHPATGPEHYTEKEAERWRAIGLFLCENFPGSFRAGEWNASISWCMEEEGLDIGYKAAEAEAHKARIEWH